MSKSRNSISIPFLVFLIFLILKITNQIDWSWWWITSPLWVPLILTVSVITIGVIVVLLWVAWTGKNVEDFFQNILKKD